jgi:hypothetical protein
MAIRDGPFSQWDAILSTALLPPSPTPTTLMRAVVMVLSILLMPDDLRLNVP